MYAVKITNKTHGAVAFTEAGPTKSVLEAYRDIIVHDIARHRHSDDFELAGADLNALICFCGPIDSPFDTYNEAVVYEVEVVEV